MASRPVRVLVADDQLPFRKAARDVLGILPDFELIEEAESGEAAVASAASLAPDLVLMDVHMPGMGGLEAARQIVVTRPETMVILVSSYRIEDVADATAESGAVAFLPKDRFGAAALRELWSSRTLLLDRRGTREPPSRDG